VSPTIATALTPEHDFLQRVLAALDRVYGARLVSVAVFGSVGRRRARIDSDVDLLVIVEELPRGHRARLATFEPVERELVTDLRALESTGIRTELSPILRRPEELQTATPLMLDLTEDAVILADRGGVLAMALDDLRARLRRLGSRRIWTGATTWYWDLKPDYKRGEIFEL
jgi:predicted nucleotidyltransferase